MVERWVRQCAAVVAMTVLAPLNHLAYSADLAPMGHPVPGGIIVLPVGDSDTAKPIVKFGGTPVLVMQRDREWVAVLGLSLETVPGRYIVSITRPEEEVEIQRFVVKPFRYPVHRVVEKKVSRRDGSSQKRPPLRLQASTLRRVVRARSDQLMAKLPLQLPVEGLAVGEFGVRWVKDATVTPPMDHEQFEVMLGGPVGSPGRGKVESMIQMADGVFAVVIDHGMGLISVLGYLQDLTVRVGDEVTPGMKIGSVAQAQAQATRISWFVALNQALINPLLLVGAAQTQL